MDPLLEELARRDLAARAATHDDPVIQRALEILGQAVDPVQLLDFGAVRDKYEKHGLPTDRWNMREKQEGLGGFRFRDDPNIYINRESKDYKRASDEKDKGAATVMAGILAHEQIHSTEHGNQGEFAAYRKESDFLRNKLSDPGLSRAQREAIKKRLDYAESWAQLLDKGNK